MVQPAPDPAARPPGWVGRLRRVLALNGESAIFVVLEGDEVALAALYGVLRETGPVVVAMDGAGLRDAPGGSCVLFRLQEAEGPWLNLARPMLAVRKLRVFGWVKPGRLDAMRERAPDFMDWASHTFVAPPEAPEWLRRNLATVDGERGIVTIEDADFVCRALDRVVRVDPTRPWEEIEAAIKEPGWRIYAPVEDTWSAQRVAWTEWLVPGEHAALVVGNAELFPKAWSMPTRPVDPVEGGAEALEKGLDPGEAESGERSQARYGFPLAESDGFDAALLESWSAGHADVATAILARTPGSEARLERARREGMGALLASFDAVSWRTLLESVGAAFGAVRGRSARQSIELLLSVPLPLLGLEPLVLERFGELAVRDSRKALLRALRTPLRRPARESELTRLHDLRACITALDDPAAALPIWERLVLPGYQRLDWRDRIAAVHASIASARLRIGDLAGALSAAEPVITTPEGARVTAAVLRLRNEPDAAASVLAKAGIPEPDSAPSRARVGTTWIR